MTIKTLSERLVIHAKTQDGKSRAVLLALREEIQQAIHDGWPIKAIWELLKTEGKIDVGYHAFNKRVNRLIKPSLVKMDTQTQESKKETPKKNTQVVTKTSSTQASGFTFNPTPNKEDLL